MKGVGGDGPGVYGSSTDNHGVKGAGGRENAGVLGECTLGPGVLGRSDQAYGVEAHGATGLYARGTERAALLDGDVIVTGTVSDSVNVVRIDHPSEPEDRFLVHAAVESAELKNVYDGTAVLDEEGRATVELPEWFESLNESFRYQLTAVGAPAPELHVSRPLTGHAFAIAGGGPGLEVCWQVTGVRCDDWARAHPLTADEEKAPEEKGFFVHPELVGRPPDQALSARRRARTAPPVTGPRGRTAGTGRSSAEKRTRKDDPGHDPPDRPWGGGAVALAAVPGVEHQLDPGRAVDEVLTGQRDVADGGAVGKEDEEVVAVVVRGPDVFDQGRMAGVPRAGTTGFLRPPAPPGPASLPGAGGRQDEGGLVVVDAVVAGEVPHGPGEGLDDVVGAGPVGRRPGPRRGGPRRTVRRRRRGPR